MIISGTFARQIGALKAWIGTYFIILLKIEGEEQGNIAYIAPPLLRIKRTNVEEALPTTVYPRQVLCCTQHQFEEVKEEYEIAQCVDLVLEGRNHDNLVAFINTCLEKTDILGGLDERRAMSITFGCKRGRKQRRTQQPAEKVAIKIAKVGCTFRLRCTLDTQRQQVVFLELGPHTNHLVGAPTDVVYLKPHPKVMALTKYYLALGQRPMQIVRGIDRWIDEKTMTSGISFLDTFKGRRYCITEEDVYKVRKMECRGKRLDLNDVTATNRLLDSLGEEVVLYRQEQVVNDIGEIIKDLIIVICT